jgi:hypothetical protein
VEGRAIFPFLPRGIDYLLFYKTLLPMMIAGMVESRDNPHHHCPAGVAERSNAADLKMKLGVAPD